MIKFGNYIKESVTTEFPFVISEKFKNILNEINHPISSMIKDLKTSSVLSFVEVEQDDNVSYIPIGKVNQILSSKNLTTEDFFNKKGISDEEYDVIMKRFWNSYRQTTKIGRFIKRIFGFLDESDIMKFVNKFKIKEMDMSLFEIVKGYDIMKWYLEDNYIVEPPGTLGASCMKQPERNKFLEMYALNSEKISMLILHKSKDNPKIVGRAIIWNVDSPKITFMDRVYYISDEILEIFHNFARKNGIYFKSKQTYGRHPVCSPDDRISYIDMTVKLNDIEYDYYPYIDTLQWIDIPKKILRTQYTGHEVLLSRTNGKFKNLKTDDDYVVDYKGNRVYRRTVVWCEIGKLYAPAEMTVKLRYIGAHAMKDYPGIVFSKSDDTYARESDCYYSDLEEDYIIKQHTRRLKYMNVFVSRTFADANCKYSEMFDDFILKKDAVLSKYHYNNFIYKDRAIEVVTENGLDYVDPNHLKSYDQVIKKDDDKYYLIKRSE